MTEKPEQRELFPGATQKTEQKTRVVNLRKESYDVYIGRGRKPEYYRWEPCSAGYGQFGSPFPITEGSSREESIRKYKDYFYDRIRKDPDFKSSVEALRGKTLGCFCKPKACHGDIIADYLNNKRE